MAPRKRNAERPPENPPSPEAAPENNDVEMEDVGEKESELDLDVELEKLEDGSIKLGGLVIPPPPPPALTFDNDDEKPRLVITHIENKNFKSYAGMQTLGPFHKSFTSIVGPNGSGKSNVIDSMLFVFGYRAQQIRSKKISVLIHNSENHPDVRSCTVKVFFQEIIDKNDRPDGQPVEGSQFSVARTAFKDNSSYYELNGKKQTLKEVSTFLKKKGIDLDHNRFLILQGEVEQIAQMKPKGVNVHDTGMLEFLEDIIGSSRFQEPIELLKKTKDELEELRSEKLNRVKTVEKEKDELEGPRNKAIEYLKFDNQITEKKNLQYQKYIQECSKLVEEVEIKKQKFEEKSKDVIEKVEKITNEKKEYEAKQKEAEQELNEIRKLKEQNMEKFKQVDLEGIKLNEEMKATNEKRNKLKVARKAAQQNYEENLNTPETNRAKIEECETLKENFDKELAQEQSKLDEARATLQSETKVYQDEKEKMETNLVGLKKNVNEKESALRVAQNELSLVKQKEDKEKCRLDQLILSKDTSKSKLVDIQRRKEELKKVLPETQKKASILEKEASEASEKEEKLSSSVRTMEVTVNEKRSSYHASKHRGKVLNEIMKQKKLGEIPGILGRLGDLGAIDKEYDVAISTATGSGLDTILVEDFKTGEECIGFLKKYNLGRSDFLCLDKTQQWAKKAHSKIQTPENVPRLFDLIRPADPKFATAFYHSVRDTLVAKDLDQADRIALTGPRYRVVTLNGELIEQSGVKSGGGREVMKGKMGSEVVQNEKDDKDIQVLEDKLKAAKTELHRIVQEKMEKEAALHKFQRDGQNYQKEMDKLNREEKIHLDKTKELEVQITKQEKVVEQSRPDPKDTKDLEEKISALEDEYNEAKAAADEVHFEVKKINGKIKEVMGSKLKVHQKKVSELNDKIEKIKSEIARLKAGIKKAERELQKNKDKVDDYQTQIEEAQNILSEKKAKRTELIATGTELHGIIKQKEEEEEEAETKYKQTQKEIETLVKKEREIKEAQLEVNEKLEAFQSKIKEESNKLKHWKRNVHNLKLREIPGETVPDLKTYEEEELSEVDSDQLNFELARMEEKMSTMKPNQAAIEAYRRKEAVYLDRVEEFTKISERRDKQRKNHDDLRKLRLNEFMQGFSIITAKLKEMYQMITLGGDAELELVDTLDPFTEGIVFSVRPPNKSWKSISNLSGGEKTLSSLALIFALHFYKPTPLYVMDEIDAALDFKNVSIVANYIKERTKNAQFIIISLRSNMFELADRLVGIYKTYNCTKSATINPGLVCGDA